MPRTSERYHQGSTLGNRKRGSIWLAVTDTIICGSYCLIVKRKRGRPLVAFPTASRNGAMLEAIRVDLGLDQRTWAALLGMSLNLYRELIRSSSTPLIQVEIAEHIRDLITRVRIGLESFEHAMNILNPRTTLVRALRKATGINWAS